MENPHEVEGQVTGFPDAGVVELVAVAAGHMISISSGTNTPLPLINSLFLNGGNSL